MQIEQTPIQEACLKAGGQVELAKILGVSPAYVNQLVKAKRPIPPIHCVKIDLCLGISRKLLRPNDWCDIWPELVMNVD